LWPLNYRIKAEPEKVNVWLDIFAVKHNLKTQDLSGLCRLAQIVTARHVAMWFLKNNTPFSYKAIGEIFNRDHSTALHAYRKIENLLEIGDQMSKFSVDIAHLTALEIWPVKD
jgi:chromosomal replication initiation ATPase DnaA